MADWVQNFINSYNNKYKQRFSEVFTPFKIAKEMIEYIPNDILSTFNLKWLDAGCGSGNISLVIYKILYMHFKDRYSRTDILNNIHLLDINNDRLMYLKSILPCINTYNTDFLQFQSDKKFDVIVSNPPFIVEYSGIRETIWDKFFNKCIECLNPGGILSIILPSIWMKPEHKMFNYITSFQICKIKCLNNNEANKIFGGDARTPMCYMILRNEMSNGKINIYDNSLKSFISYNIRIKPIPMYFPYLVNKLSWYIAKYGSLKSEMIKSNCPSKLLSFSDTPCDDFKYKNIKTCKLNKYAPYLVCNYSNNSCKSHNNRKVILCNKMYGIPYYDKEGKYGISTRDNYLYIENNDVKCRKIFDYLNCNLIYIIYETTRYRMGYLEKYAYELIPNILNMPLDSITNDSIQSFFNLSLEDIAMIDKFISKKRIKSFKIDE
jgi:trans-aconitate methyltransferase